MNRRRVGILGSILAAFLLALILKQSGALDLTVIGPVQELGSDRNLIGVQLDAEGVPSPGNPASRLQTTPFQDCRRLLLSGLRNRRIQFGFTALGVMNLHRANPDFRALADDFLRQSGEDLLPICRELLRECRSESAHSLLAALLGHARRPEAFDLLRDLIEAGMGPPEARDLQASAIYSMGLIQSPQSMPFLLKQFSEVHNADKNISEKFGTPLMAAIGLCGKEAVPILREAALRGLPPEMQPDADEGLRHFRWSYLALVDSPEAFSELKSIAEQDSDVRIRGMAVAALGQSSDPEQRAYLADLFARDESPLIRRTILESLNDGTQYGSLEWAAMRGQLAEPLKSILRAFRVPSGDESADFSAIRLAVNMGTPEASKCIENWMQAASKGAYPPDSFWMDIAVEVMAKSGQSLQQVESFLQANGISGEDRLDYLCTLEILSDGPRAGPELMKEWMQALERTLTDKAHPYSMYKYWSALGKVPAKNEDLEACVARMVELDDRLWRLNAIKYSVMAGESALLPLSRHLCTTEVLSEQLQTAGAYLQVLPEEAVPDLETETRLRSLFSSTALEALGSEATYYSETIGLYFSRFGSTRDLEWLESLPARISLRRADLDLDELSDECARAADAIRLRSN